jgi:hypothetical protein
MLCRRLVDPPSKKVGIQVLVTRAQNIERTPGKCVRWRFDYAVSEVLAPSCLEQDVPWLDRVWFRITVRIEGQERVSAEMVL